jgi:DNA-binding protein H-NS
MPKPNLEKMTREQLLSLRAEIDAVLKAQADGQRAAALSEVREIVERYGFSIDAVLGRDGAGNAPPRFRHPENPEITWTGHGRRPGWYTAAIARGVASETMAV